MEDPSPSSSPAPPPLPVAPPALPVVSGGLTSEEQTLAMLCHLLSIFTGFLGPLVLWLVKKDSSAYIDHHGREAVNFQLTILLVMIVIASVAFPLMLILVGIFLIPLLVIIPILALIAEIMAAVAAQNGEWHRYPCCIRFCR
jgi:uncharacterized Tic20 family protein